MLYFFFKPKTAYELRISYWSSDVCSSDLATCDRFDPRLARGLVELDVPKQVAQVRQRKRGLAKCRRPINQIGNPGNAVHNRKLGVGAQVNKDGNRSG